MLEENLEIWVRKPFYVEAVQVTDDNMEVVAAWCNGKILMTKTTSVRYIKVFVKNPMTPRQTKAFPSDWVLKSGDSFKVYKHDSFIKVFDKTDYSDLPVEVTEAIDLTRLSENK